MKEKYTGDLIEGPGIYAMCEQGTDAVRYVGKAVNVRKRIQQSFFPSQLARKSRKHSWIKSMLKADKAIEVFLLQPAADITELDQLETIWIANCKTLGCDLTNHTNGGEGGSTNHGKKFCKQWRQRISRANKGRARPKGIKPSAAHLAKLVLLSRKLTDEQEVVLCEQYNLGASMQWLATYYKITKTTVRAIMHKHGHLIGNRVLTKFTPEQENHICELYNLGASTNWLSKHYDMKPSSICSLIRRGGHMVREKGNYI